MQCDICGTTEDLVKVKNEDREMIYLCQACYETHYEDFEKEDVVELKEDGEEEWEEELQSKDEEEDELLEDEEELEDEE